MSDAQPGRGAGWLVVARLDRIRDEITREYAEEIATTRRAVAVAAAGDLAGVEQHWMVQNCPPEYTGAQRVGLVREYLADMEEMAGRDGMHPDRHRPAQSPLEVGLFAADDRARARAVAQELAHETAAASDDGYGESYTEVCDAGDPVDEFAIPEGRGDQAAASSGGRRGQRLAAALGTTDPLDWARASVLAAEQSAVQLGDLTHVDHHRHGDDQDHDGDGAGEAAGWSR